MGAAEETNGCLGRNQWVPWEEPMVSAEAPAGNRIYSGTAPIIYTLKFLPLYTIFCTFADQSQKEYGKEDYHIAICDSDAHQLPDLFLAAG